MAQQPQPLTPRRRAEPLAPSAAEVLRAALGWPQDVAAEVEAEALFAHFDRLGELDEFAALRRLTLIKCEIRSFGSLASLGQNVRRLCLTECGLRHIPPLGPMPALTELLLHENFITEISHLDGCVALQKLWLWNNRLVDLGGIGHLSRLRELWVQGNQLRKLRELDRLGSLQVLGLANNPISDIRELASLAELPALYDVSLADPHFGACPVVALDGYREFMLRTLTQISVLDTMLIGDAQRTELRDVYIDEVQRFNGTLADIKRMYATEVSELEARRSRALELSESIQDQIGQSIGDMERAILATRQQIEDMIAQRIQTSDDLFHGLESTLQQLESEYDEEIEALLVEERRKLQREDAFFDGAKQTLEALRQHRLRLLGLSETGTVVCAELDERSPEFRFVAQHVDRSPANAGRSPFALLAVHQALNQSLMRKLDSHAQPEARKERAFFAASARDLYTILERGFEHMLTESVDEGCITFYRSMKAAAAHAPDNIVLLCTLRLNTVLERTREQDTNAEPLVVPPDYDATIVARGQNGVILLANPFLAYPEFVVRYEPSGGPFVGVSSVSTRLIDRVHDVSATSASFARLQAVEERLQQAVWDYERALILEVDPKMVDDIRAQEAESGGLRETIRFLKDQISSEKRTQEQLIQKSALRSLRRSRGARD